MFRRRRRTWPITIEFRWKEILEGKDKNIMDLQELFELVVRFKNPNSYEGFKNLNSLAEFIGTDNITTSLIEVKLI